MIIPRVARKRPRETPWRSAAGNPGFFVLTERNERREFSAGAYSPICLARVTLVVSVVSLEIVSTCSPLARETG